MKSKYPDKITVVSSDKGQPRTFHLEGFDQHGNPVEETVALGPGPETVVSKHAYSSVGWTPGKKEERKMKNVYKFDVDHGRGYEVHGVFVATPEEVASAIGKTASFGEICGKHSEMDVDLEEGMFQTVEASEEVVSFVEVALGGGSGYNPLNYIRCDECRDTADYCCCSDEKEEKHERES